MIGKSTHERIELWQPVVKTEGGKYIAVLSDDSLDRDDEIVGKSALQKIKNNDGYTAMLLNHKNDVMGQIGEWVNKRIEEIDGHTAFVAEPKFYTSNPNAKIIKGCLDEGAQYGISIGAIPKNFEYVELDGRRIKKYTELELLEASWVAIPSNRHGMAMRVAKMFTKEDKMTEKQFEQKDIDTAVEKSVAESKEEMDKVVKTHTDEIEKMVKDHTEALEKVAKEHSEAVEKLTAEHKESIEKMESTLKENSEELEKLKKMSVLKGDDSTSEDGDGTKKEDVEKAIASGKIPVVSK